MAAFGQVAMGQDYDTLIEASANLLLNGLRQKHPKLEGAEDQLDRVFAEMRGHMVKDVYDSNGNRRESRIIIPPKPIGELIRN
jgi:hypothetical protein